MKKVRVCAAVLAMLCMAGCGTGREAVAVTDFSGEWDVVNVKGEAVDLQAGIFIGFDQATNRVYGHAGCNRLMGAYHVDSLERGKMDFAQVAATRMMCPDMSLEQNVLDALGKVAGFTQSGDTVVLKDAEGKSVMVLLKRATPVIAFEDLEGRWIVTNVGSVPVGEVERTPELDFDMETMRMSGNAGCNTINGHFSREEGKTASLRFSQVISTMMACPNMETEQDILKALDKVRGFDRGKDENTVVLLDGEGVSVLTLTRAENEPVEN